MTARIKERDKQELAACLSNEASQLVYVRFGSDAYDALTKEQLMAAVKCHCQDLQLQGKMRQCSVRKVGRVC